MWCHVYILYVNETNFLIWMTNKDELMNLWTYELNLLQCHLKRHWMTPFKESNATRLWSIISICLGVYIHHVRYYLKAWLFLSFHWYFIILAWFFPGLLKWVQCQKINVAKLDHNFNRWYQFVYEIIFILLTIMKAYLFSFWLVCYLLWLSVRNVRKVIISDAMLKIYVPKWHHYFKFSMMVSEDFGKGDRGGGVS